MILDMTHYSSPAPRDREDLLRLGLPRWSQMWTTGTPVTPDQAREIIRRTDSFFTLGRGGNDEHWDRVLARRLRMPHLWHDHPTQGADWNAWEEARERWVARWGGICTASVRNSWISCNVVYGPHGWCHPSGTIAFVDNVGKWPSVQDILDDWRLLASAFPFLDLAATLMSGEECDEGTRPVVTFLVRGGAVNLTEGSLRHHDAYPAASRRADADYMYVPVGPSSREHGPIPQAWYDDWAQLAERLQASPG